MYISSQHELISSSRGGRGVSPATKPSSPETNISGNKFAFARTRYVPAVRTTNMYNLKRIGAGQGSGGGGGDEFMRPRFTCIRTRTTVVFVNSSDN